MICQDCQTAGLCNQERNKRAKQAPQIEWSEITSTHELCEGGTWCDCQHLVGVFAGRPSGVV